MSKSTSKSTSKRLRPSLKDYLKTGEVRLGAPPGSQTPPSEFLAVSAASAAPAAERASSDEDARAFLELLSESDRQTWEPIFRSGSEIRRPAFDAAALREDFRVMDRSRCTYYILEEPNTPLRAVRTSVRIREPFVLLLKWDETGVLDIYGMP
jgi:hypothetical protein